MILLKTALLVGFQGAIIPKLGVTYMPVKSFYVSQELAVNANDKYSQSLAQLNLEAGVILKNWTFAVGHEAVVQDIQTLRNFDFVEISYRKEF
jgi:hypothetical protein